jgi:hypothetical protein
MPRLSLAIPLVAIFVLATAMSCDSKTPQANPTPVVSSVVTPSGGAASPTAKVTGPPPAAQWPTPEDCITYNPSTVTSHYEAGIWQISDGSHVIMRLHGGPTESVLGMQGVALAKRYKRHCFLGRSNSREEHGEYVFDYWRDSSGNNPSIPDENCSDYNKNNLTVEDMGGGNGWRVKDHDHPLQLFDNESDAKNGKLVLQKYSHICFIDEAYDQLDRDPISYFP